MSPESSGELAASRSEMNVEEAEASEALTLVAQEMITEEAENLKLERELLPFFGEGFNHPVSEINELNKRDDYKQ
jgi:hypothetical protein